MGSPPCYIFISSKPRCVRKRAPNTLRKDQGKTDHEERQEEGKKRKKARCSCPSRNRTVPSARTLGGKETRASLTTLIHAACNFASFLTELSVQSVGHQRCLAISEKRMMQT